MLRELARLEFCRIHFALEFIECVDLPGETVQRLRRDLRRAGRLVLDDSVFNALLDPAPSGDPLARRRYQRPGPPFVMAPAQGLPGTFEAGELFHLTVDFWGSGIQFLPSFVATLETLGRSGLWQGAGPFEISSIQSEDAAGFRCDVPLGQGDPLLPAVPINDLGWWLDTRLQAEDWQLSLVTPARLIAGGRPLFQAGFPQLFPFILRRVTSMAFAHCGAELVDRPEDVLQAARDTTVRQNLLHWQDWRSLTGDQGTIDLGGLSGSLILDGPLDEDLLNVLHLGSLLNLGKGATFACGCYRLTPVS